MTRWSHFRNVTNVKLAEVVRCQLSHAVLLTCFEIPATSSHCQMHFAHSRSQNVECSVPRSVQFRARLISRQTLQVCRASGLHPRVLADCTANQRAASQGWLAATDTSTADGTLHFILQPASERRRVCMCKAEQMFPELPPYGRAE